MKFCISCETDSVVFGKTKITVGREVFETKADHCTKCGRVGITPQIQKEIDSWAQELAKNIIELQPYFSSEAHSRIDTHAKEHGFSRAQFIKACTAFYILELTKMKNFKKIRIDLLNKAEKNYAGTKQKICVPIRYNLFKKIDLFKRVWNLEYDSHVAEEAVLCCLAMLDYGKRNQKLLNYVETFAVAS